MAIFSMRLIVIIFIMFLAKDVKISITYSQAFPVQSKTVSFKLRNSTYFLINNHGFKFSFEQNNFVFTPEFVIPGINSEILFVEVCSFFSYLQCKNRNLVIK